MVVAAVLATGVALIFSSGYIQLEPNSPNGFAGSSSCLLCHSKISKSWQRSLHHKMMRRTSEPGAVVAHWSSSDPQPGFLLQEAVWVVGSKWQQQFMGRDGTHDTMLPGAWSVELQRWIMQGWDGWQTPKPEERCHGCHVVGLDEGTGRFTEPGIGCESCHGQGQWHMDAYGRGPIYNALDSEVCGQCHTRGHATKGPYFFPVNYVLGSSLDAAFTEIKPDFIQNSAQWWGDGRERDRHQEYPAWRRGGHVDSLKVLQVGYDNRYGPVSPTCLRCHSAEAAVFPERPIPVAKARNGITCAVCHNVHGQLDQVRMSCEACHDNGPFHHRDVKLTQHVPCPVAAKVSCVNCHMPITVKVGGQFQLHSHAPGITTPEEGARFDGPSSCANGGCHQATSTDRLQRAFDRFYATRLRSADSAEPGTYQRPQGSG